MLSFIGVADNWMGDKWAFLFEFLCIAGEDNLHGRDMIAFYRHYQYSLDKWHEYREFVSGRLGVQVEKSNE